MSEPNLKLIVNNTDGNMKEHTAESTQATFEQDDSIWGLLDLIEEYESNGQYFMIY